MRLGITSRRYRRIRMGQWPLAFAAGLACGMLFSAPADESNLPASAAAPDNVRLPAKIIIRVDQNYPPFSFRDSSGQMTGFTVELITSVLDAVRVPYVVQASTWSNVVNDLAEHRRPDMVAQMAYADSRAEKLDYSPAVGRFSFDVLTRPDQRFHSLESLRNRELIVLQNGIMADYLRQSGLTSRVLLAPDDPTMLRWLAAGRGDGALTQKLSGLYIAAQLGIRVHPNDLDILPQSEHLVVAKGNQALLDRLTEGLNIVNTTGRLDALREKWFGVEKPVGTPSTPCARGIWLAILLLALVSAFIGWRIMYRTMHRRTAESRRAERQLRGILETLPIGAYEIDCEGRILLVNNTFLRITGYTIEETLGMHVWNFMEPGPSRDALPDLLRQMAIDQPPLKPYFCHNRHKSGRPIPVQIDWTYRRDADGRVTGFVCTLSDITERRRIEQRLLESEKMDAFGRIAGGVAADFDAQLETIIGYAERLQQGLSDPSLRACADGIAAAGQAANELVRHLQAFAHKSPMRRERVDLHACLKTVAGVLHHTSDPRMVITLQLDAPRYVVTGDPAQLENLFLNLGLNARDAMPGNGTLTVRTTVEPAVGPAADQLCIRVMDTGCGIAREHLPHLFEPFFSTKGPHERLGLGLATVYGTVQQHGGSITVESEPGVGSTFTVRLPLTPQK